MTPKEKAEQMIDDIDNEVDLYINDYDISEEWYKTFLKNCALLSVDEILKVAFYANEGLYQFYHDVKKEIDIF